MAKFDMEQTMAVVAVTQLMSQWAGELDQHNGANIGDYVTEDCVYIVGGAPREGRAAVKKFYGDRLERLSKEGPMPTMRHNISNLIFTFKSPTEIKVDLTLVFFTTMGVAAGPEHSDPAAVADVWMEARKGADGEWLISRNASNQCFRRPAE
jgi:ketosteroid isomerase-like protein